MEDTGLSFIAEKEKNLQITDIVHPVCVKAGVSLSLLRLDLLDEHVSGNKWFKLKYNLMQAVASGAEGVVSFGGPYSNHLHALAAACHHLGLSSVALLRGELQSEPTPTLKDCMDWGMEIVTLSRVDYRKRFEPDFISEKMRLFPGYELIPEGGSNALAIRGVSEMLVGVLARGQGWRFIVTPVGSAGTLAGCIDAVSEMRESSCRGGRLPPELTVIGVSALKGGQADISGRLSQLLGKPDDRLFELWHDCHFGGFGKIPSELIQFIREFYCQTGVELDPVYTAKMMHGLLRRIASGCFPEGSRLLALHTGGLQGARSLKN